MKRRLNGRQNKGLDHCWASTKNGGPCSRRCQKNVTVPYCAHHLKVGDDAFLIKEHAVVGQILVAAFDLPKGYKSVYFGTRKAYSKCSVKAQDYVLNYLVRGGKQIYKKIVIQMCTFKSC